MGPFGHLTPVQSIDPSRYQQQLDDKLSALAGLLKPFEPPAPDVFASSPRHFRMRAEFRIWHEGDRSSYAMNRPGSKKPEPIDDFPIGSPAMVEVMPRLLASINANELLRRKLYAVEFLTTRGGQVLATLIYHRPLDNSWQSAAMTVEQQLGIHLIGRSRKQKVVLSQDWVEERFTVGDRLLRYQQVETGFTQPNGDVNEQMLNWAHRVTLTDTPDEDLLELYCGNGNFTLALADNFRQVLATEVSKLSVQSARHNIAANEIDNIRVVRMSSEEFTQALNGVRPFTRLRDIDLTRYRFSTLFVDPPRAGLDEGTVALAKDFNKILYISCNPLTLKENLLDLSESHHIEEFAVFDQFPYTHHLECGVLLTRKAHKTSITAGNVA
ncbi:MAG: tRNA (uridine(54)-C5)-methyltransferase TrmA [Porticoccaceae bacterium]|nr:tRNA (uridine(54)-C5)-methyltransferase TrmA [Porticoccaceae bacterium]